MTAKEAKAGDRLPTLSAEVTATTVVLGALASRDWRPMHHDRDFAIHRNGTRDIFMNTPNQAAWFERYLTDWSGATGRLGRMKFRMRDSVFPGDTMTLDGVIRSVETDDRCCTWVAIDVTLAVDGEPKTECSTRMAIPSQVGDNPWKRRGDEWRP